MSKTKSKRSVPLDVFLKEGMTDSRCQKCNTAWTKISCQKCNTAWTKISPDDFSKHVNKCRGVPNAVPIPSAGKGHSVIIEMAKNDRKKERANQKKLKNSIVNAEKKRAARAAADAAAEAKGKTDMKGNGGKKGKKN